MISSTLSEASLRVTTAEAVAQCGRASQTLPASLAENKTSTRCSSVLGFFFKCVCCLFFGAPPPQPHFHEEQAQHNKTHSTHIVLLKAHRKRATLLVTQVCHTVSSLAIEFHKYVVDGLQRVAMRNRHQRYSSTLQLGVKLVFVVLSDSAGALV